jgi:phosphohistidine phosphatase SixA
MALYLVRHAVAVGRSAWHHADEKRPLTPKGRRQAQALLRLLDGVDVRRILSSPAVRCRETVEPLAAAHRLEVRDTPELAEGHGARKAMEVLTEAAAKKGDSVLCAHGDLIPELLRRLGREGVRLESGPLFAKGSTWELHVEDDRIVRGLYHPPAE